MLTLVTVITSLFVFSVVGAVLSLVFKVLGWTLRVTFSILGLVLVPFLVIFGLAQGLVVFLPFVLIWLACRALSE